MPRYLVSASAITLAAFSFGGPVLAQDSGSGAAAGQQDPGLERSASEITCADISTMDTALVPGVLYFIAGHRAGMQETGSGSDAAQSAATADASSGSPDVPQTGGEDAQASADASGTAGEGAAGTTGEAGETQLMRVAGHFEIPVERTVIACAEAPESRVSDVIDEQRGQAGSGMAGGSTGGTTGTTQSDTAESGDGSSGDSGNGGSASGGSGGGSGSGDSGGGSGGSTGGGSGGSSN